MKIIFFGFLVLMQLALHAQKKPTQANINKAKQSQEAILKQLNKELKEIEEDDPDEAEVVKDVIKQAQKQTKILLKDTIIRVKDGITRFQDFEEDKWQIPAKQVKTLSALPKEILSTEKLRAFISDIKDQLYKNVSPQTLQAAEKIFALTGNNPTLISNSAVAAWYKNNDELSLLLSAKAADLTSSENAIINTLGAVLNLCGYEYKAIPVLLHLNSKHPNNSTVLNNLGQAYLGLGEQRLAEQYLLQCIALSTSHIEANKSLALLYKATGQLSKAKAAIQRSLEGGYSHTALEIATEIGISEDIIDELIIKPVKNKSSKQYFDPYKYQIPQLCENVDKAAEVAENHKKFQVFLESEIEKYERLLNEENENITKNIENISAVVKKGQLVNIHPSPLSAKAIRMFNYWQKEFENFLVKDWLPTVKKNSEQKSALDQAYREAHAQLNMRQGRCDDFNWLANNYLPKYAALDQQSVDFLIPYRGYMDEFIFWSKYYDFIGDGRYRLYSFINNYLKSMLDLSRRIKIIFPACTPYPVFEFAADTAVIEEPFCPIKVVIPLGVAKLSFTCTQYELDAGEGVIINYSGSFKRNTPSTLAIGPGYSNHIPGVDLGAKAQFYIVFDGDNKPSDGGFKLEAGGEITVGGIQVESKTSATLGLSSGFKVETVSGDETKTLIELPLEDK